jgi:3-methyladenine DNA glycosylase AlkD
LNELKTNVNENYKSFNKNILGNDKLNVLGVKVPVLRKLAKKYGKNLSELLYLPDEYYEVTFIKLIAASSLTYDKFITVVDDCVKLIDNWATCDSFKAKCISEHKNDFLPYIDKYLSIDKPFYQRYALTSLLNFYVEEEYLKLIFDSLKRANTNYYYVHMAVAWLLAEVLVKYYDDGVQFIKSCVLDKKTSNKAIQKAIESFRLSDENKKYLKTLKR